MDKKDYEKSSVGQSKRDVTDRKRVTSFKTVSDGPRRQVAKTSTQQPPRSRLTPSPTPSPPPPPPTPSPPPPPPQEEDDEEEQEEEGGKKKTAMNIVIENRPKKEYPPDNTPNVAFFTNFTMEFVKENLKNYYFIIKVLGQEDFRFYKNKMVALCNAYQQAMLACDENYYDTKRDREIMEKVVDDDPKRGFQSRMMVNVYYKKLLIYLRIFVLKVEIGNYVPSKRAIKFEYDEREFEKFTNFANTKLKYAAREEE